MTSKLEMQALSTDQRLLEAICEFVERDDHLVYRSHRFPTYYGGNGLEIRRPMGRSLSEWEHLFHQSFPRDQFTHETFTFSDAPEFAPLLKAARDSGYNVEFERYMALLPNRVASQNPPEGRTNLQVVTVQDDTDWARFAAFHRATAEDKDWFDPNVVDDPLVTKTRFVAEQIGVKWALLCAEGKDIPLARAGIFVHRGVARLQDVETHPKHLRKGHATRLLQYLIRYAVDDRKAEVVFVSADEDPPALALYRSLGFRPLGRHVTLMRYPRIG